METLIVSAIVGFVAFIAGRGMVGSNKVTKEYAEHIASLSYVSGYREGIKFSVQTVEVFGVDSIPRLMEGLEEPLA